MVTHSSCAAVALLLLFSPAAFGDLTLAGLSWSGSIYDVNAATGATSNARSTGYGGLIGIADGVDGNLYALSTGATTLPNALLRIDAETGATQYIGDTGLTIAEGDLDFDPITGILFGSHSTANNGLFSINPSTGAATIIGVVAGAGDLSAMAFAADGSLYLLDTTNDLLFEVNPLTAFVISTRPVNHNFRVLAGMDFHPQTGVLYVADGNLDADIESLYTLDPTTGGVVEIGPLGISSGLSGLRFIPEPSTAALLAVCAMVCRRQRRRG